MDTSSCSLRQAMNAAQLLTESIAFRAIGALGVPVALELLARAGRVGTTAILALLAHAGRVGTTAILAVGLLHDDGLGRGQTSESSCKAGRRRQRLASRHAHRGTARTTNHGLLLAGGGGRL